MTLKVGDRAPEFDVVARQRGEDRNVRLADLRGRKNLVLYFYPRDFTAVCTIETCGFRDMYEELAADDTEIVGVSVDSAESHQRFAAEHRIPFPLVADTGRELATKYDATSFLRDLLGVTRRVTYVIDKSGVIAGIFDSAVRASQHLGGVRSTLATLRSRG